VRAIVLDGACLRRKCDVDHDLGYELTQRVAHILMQRLQATRLQLLDVYNVQKQGRA
jgi:CRP/FNR family cyclic AMP-dependent transcriptional regulator